MHLDKKLCMSTHYCLVYHVATQICVNMDSGSSALPCSTKPQPELIFTYREYVPVKFIRRQFHKTQETHEPPIVKINFQISSLKFSFIFPQVNMPSCISRNIASSRYEYHIGNNIIPHVWFMEKWCHLSDTYRSQYLSTRPSENHLAIAEMRRLYGEIYIVSSETYALKTIIQMKQPKQFNKELDYFDSWNDGLWFIQSRNSMRFLKIV